MLTEPVVNVRLVKPGSCVIEPGNRISVFDASLKWQLGVGGGSAVTLVLEGSDLLLVDTGYERESDVTLANDERNWRLLEFLLELQGFRIPDISHVFITHFHRDHFGGIEHFERAKWYCHEDAAENLHPRLRDRFTPVSEGDSIIRNTRVIHTPGHTKGHASILWANDILSVKVGICGDAILSLAWLLSGHCWKFNADFFDAVVAKKSADRLLKEADVLIPGHGQPFFSRTISGQR